MEVKKKSRFEKCSLSIFVSFLSLSLSLSLSLLLFLSLPLRAAGETEAWLRDFEKSMGCKVFTAPASVSSPPVRPAASPAPPA